MGLNVNFIGSASSGAAPSDDSSGARTGGPPTGTEVVTCPKCGGDIADIAITDEWQQCPFCQTRLQIRAWPVIRQSSKAAAAILDHATCYFHPENAFQACCQRCGRFLCALCDLQLGAEHVCPTCFERGRSDAGTKTVQAEWRYRDVLYDSIALSVGWGWIIFWPTFIIALPATIVLHVKYRKAPRSYLIPRSGWRFWMAYVGLFWLPLLLLTPLLLRLLTRH